MIKEWLNTFSRQSAEDGHKLAAIKLAGAERALFYATTFTIVVVSVALLDCCCCSSCLWTWSAVRCTPPVDEFMFTVALIKFNMHIARQFEVGSCPSCPLAAVGQPEPGVSPCGSRSGSRNRHRRSPSGKGSFWLRLAFWLHLSVEAVRFGLLCFEKWACGRQAERMCVCAVCVCGGER